MYRAREVIPTATTLMAMTTQSRWASWLSQVSPNETVQWHVQRPSASQIRCLLFLFCFDVIVKGKVEEHSSPVWMCWATSIHPHGFIVIQQDTWQVRNGEEEGRCSEGGREAEKVEEDRRICSKQASYTIHATRNVWKMLGECYPVHRA